MQLKGILQVDSRTFFDNPAVAGNDGLLLRRARPILQGTVFRDFDFLFVPDFAPSSGPTIFDAYVNYRYSPALQFQAGKFKVPIGLEQLQADRDILFNERSLVTDLVPNRDVGFELHGDLFDGRAELRGRDFQWHQRRGEFRRMWISRTITRSWEGFSSSRSRSRPPQRCKGLVLVWRAATRRCPRRTRRGCPQPPAAACRVTSRTVSSSSSRTTRPTKR